MKLYDIEKLQLDPNQILTNYNKQGFSSDVKASGLNNGDKLYNLFDPTFKLNSGKPLVKYQVKKEDEMRIDIISNTMYGTVDQCDFILSINDIDNPLNIMSGDELHYPDYSSIADYRIKTPDNDVVRAKFLNANKTTKIDNNRKLYQEKNYSLPPTFQDVAKPSVQIQNNQIVIGQ